MSVSPRTLQRSTRRLARQAWARLRQVAVREAVVGDRRLRLRLAARGVRLGPATAVTLVGPRQRVEGVWLDATTVEFDLHQVPPFGTRATVLRPGSYAVEATVDGRIWPVRSELAVPFGYADPELSVDLGVGERAVVEVAPTRRAAERGDAGRQRLRAGYRRSLTTPLRDAVHLTCFDGRGVGDNVGPVAAELARRRPELDQCWTVADPSVEVPSGASAVLTRTAEWWASQATARVVVVNCWLPVGFQKRPGQTIVQTWHGTPYKSLGLDRLSVDGERADDEKRAAGLRRHAEMWDVLLAQNPYSARIFARAYGFDRDPLLVGYPRNDRLVTGYGSAALASVRQRLGVAAEVRLVLYAPTFRDDETGLFRGLDLAALSAGLGSDHVIMVRGHGNTVRHGRAVEGPGVIDVTLYPDLTELYAVAELMITDYSSAMFDFAITGKPMVFFVPDLERYTGSVRGGYFDLASSAPGPLTRTSAETVDAVRAGLAGERSAAEAARYLHWQERYVSTEVGTATTRTVDALLAVVDGR